MFDRTYIEEAEKNINKTVTLAGWVSRTRDLKQIRFIVLRDKTGEIQVVVKPEERGMFELDLGREDVIVVIGKIVASKLAKAGVEFIPECIEIISKSENLSPLMLPRLKSLIWTHG